jgi:hypothetical protein
VSETSEKITKSGVAKEYRKIINETRAKPDDPKREGKEDEKVQTFFFSTPVYQLSFGLNYL